MRVIGHSRIEALFLIGYLYSVLTHPTARVFTLRPQRELVTIITQA